MRKTMTRLALFGAGTLLIAIGGALMVSPRAFLALNEVVIADDPSLISELVAPIGILLIAGAVLIAAGVKLRFAGPALLLGASVYGSYGLARLGNIALHGLPSEPLITATIIEFTVAALLGALGITHTA